VKWFFQEVHHDIWDMDQSQQGMLFDLKYNGTLRHAMVSADKNGLWYVLDRVTATPIIPVELVQQSLGGGRSLQPTFDEARDEFTRSYLSQILQITAGNVSQAARLAKRNRTDFYKLLARHQLTPEEFKQR